MLPDIESIDVVSQFDPVVDDIKSKGEIRWREFKDLQPRLIRVSRLDADGQPVDPKWLAARLRDLRRNAYRAAHAAGLDHEMHWDPERFVMLVQFKLIPGQPGPDLLRPHKVQGKIKDASLRFERKRRRAEAEEAENEEEA